MRFEAENDAVLREEKMQWGTTYSRLRSLALATAWARLWTSSLP
jgi:hypothetical protein